jgi:FkbM family methyltransferase
LRDYLFSLIVPLHLSQGMQMSAVSFFKRVVLSGPDDFWTRLMVETERAAQLSLGKGSGGSGVAPEIPAVERFLPETIGVVLDIGGNKGDWTRSALARWGNRVSKLFIFEPSKHHVDSIASIGDPRVTFIQAAVGVQAGEAILYSDQAGSGMASLTRRRLDHFLIAMNQTETVQVTTLDEFISRNQIESIGFAKFDVEGHELNAMRGAEKTLAKGIIKALSFEFGGTHIDTRTFFQDFWYFLQPFGFNIYRIDRRLRPILLRHYDEAHEHFRHTNFLAVLGG